MVVNLEEISSHTRGDMSYLIVHESGDISYVHDQKGNSYLVWKGVKQVVYKDMEVVDFFYSDDSYCCELRKDGKYAYDINGKISKCYRKVECEQEYSDETRDFSDNYFCLINDKEEKMLIYNGKKVGAYYGINRKHISFLPDGKGLRYRAKRKTKGGGRERAYVINNKEGKWYDNKGELNDGISKSYIGGKVVFYRGGNTCKINICIDKENGRIYKNILEKYISEEKKTYVLVLYENKHIGFKRTQLIHNGYEGHKYDSIEWEDIAYNVERDFLVYLGKRGDKLYLVLNKVEIDCYDEVSDLCCNYQDTNNDCYAFKARKGDEWFIVYNGKRITEGSSDFSDENLILGPKRSEFAYIIKIDDKFHYVVNGNMGKGYDKILYGKYTAEGFYFKAKNKGKDIHILDNIEGKKPFSTAYDYLFGDKLYTPDYLKEVKFLNGKLIVFDKTYKFDNVKFLDFISDSKTIFFMGTKNNLNCIYKLSF